MILLLLESASHDVSSFLVISFSQSFITENVVRICNLFELLLVDLARVGHRAIWMHPLGQVVVRLLNLLAIQVLRLLEAKKIVVVDTWIELSHRKEPYGSKMIVV